MHTIFITCVNYPRTILKGLLQLTSFKQLMLLCVVGETAHMQTPASHVDHVGCGIPTRLPILLVLSC